MKNVNGILLTSATVIICVTLLVAGDRSDDLSFPQAQITTPSHNKIIAQVTTVEPVDQSKTIRLVHSPAAEKSTTNDQSEQVNVLMLANEEEKARTHADLTRREDLMKQTELFFNNNADWTVQERQQQASELDRQISWAQENEFLLPVESIQLRIGLIHAIYTDATERRERTKNLLKNHQLTTDRIQKQLPVDPRHSSYKSREAKIVSEIMASPMFTSRQERQRAIRKQLVSLRQEVYANN